LHLQKSARQQQAGTGDKQRAYIKDTLRELRLTPTALARAIGAAPSTFTRFLGEPDGSERTMHAATLDKIEQLRQVNSDQPYLTREQGQWASLREEALQFVAESDEVSRAVKALIGDRNGIDPWLLRTRALELDGYLPGDIVLVDLNATPRPGDAVCAQVYDRGHSRAETVMRQFQHAGAVNLLLPRSLDPSVQRPLVVDNDRVLIRGVLLPHRLRGKAAA
jgi:hypothetical protein